MEVSKIKDLLFSALPFYRWHPEVAVRYLPIVSRINRLGSPTVLEVGSGGLGIAPYLGREVTGLDTRFLPPVYPKLQTVIGTGEKIPFPDRSFDVVIAVDTLEHLSPKSRPRVISEMLRVARKEVIVAVPTGAASLAQDQELAEIYKRKYQSEFPFFAEHEKYGLPSEEEIKEWLGDNVRVEKNESLRLRRFLVAGWMTKNFLAKVFYWKILLLAIPLFKFFEKPPYSKKSSAYYRTIFYKTL